MKLNNETKKYISLAKAAKVYGCTPEHLNLMSRQGKLQSIKINRNRFTTLGWLKEYKRFVKKSERHNRRNSNRKNLVSNMKRIRTIHPYKVRNSISGFFKKVLLVSFVSLIVVLSIGTIHVDAKNDSFSIFNSIKSIFDFSEVSSVVGNYLKDIKDAYSEVFKLAEDSAESLAFNYVGFVEDSVERVVKKVESIKVPKIKIISEKKEIKTIVYNFKIPDFDKLIKDLDINVNESLIIIKYEENEKLVKKSIKKNQTFVGFFLESLVDGFIEIDKSFNIGLEKFGKSADRSFASVISFSKQAVSLFDLSEELGPVSEKFSNILASIGDIHKKLIETADDQRIIINEEIEEVVEKPLSNVIE